ncbi:hypothetical protein B0H16DRAFT_1486895 [Mycena metata]|uniref:Uncharacterized protein n=1 Tax=Mycena metata TaxID=1033252 RepID=A0AAD7GJ91_9AGAR|nr:hypothetical protein B0H16DRAFT_1486895 [Mycena metata]
MSYDQYTGTRSGINAQARLPQDFLDAMGSSTYTSPSSYVKKYGASVPPVETQLRLPREPMLLQLFDSYEMGSSTYASPSGYIKDYTTSPLVVVVASSEDTLILP